MRAVLSTTFRSLHVRNYRLFSTGQLVKLVGVWMMFTAQDWLVLELSHNSPGALGIVAALQFLPVLLLTLWGGKLADRYDKRKLLIGANAAFAIVAIVFAILATTVGVVNDVPRQRAHGCEVAGGEHLGAAGEVLRDTDAI